jgi:hypothetical protein
LSSGGARAGGGKPQIKHPVHRPRVNHVDATGASEHTDGAESPVNFFDYSVSDVSQHSPAIITSAALDSGSAPSDQVSATEQHYAHVSTTNKQSTHANKAVLVDTGATDHVFRDKHMFCHDFRPTKTVIRMADSKEIVATGRGTVTLQVRDKDDKDKDKEFNVRVRGNYQAPTSTTARVIKPPWLKKLGRYREKN